MVVIGEERKTMFCKIDSLYVCVDDMDRAIKFYEEFFEQEVSEKGDVGSCFEVDGFRYNLFAYKVVNEKHIYGSNCLPSLHFDTLEKMKEKLEGKEICFPLMQIGKNWVAEFVDSEGNHIEVYTAVSQ